MNCKTESYFFIMFSMVGRIWIGDGPHAVENHCTIYMFAEVTDFLLMSVNLWLDHWAKNQIFKQVIQSSFVIWINRINQ